MVAHTPGRPSDRPVDLVQDRLRALKGRGIGQLDDRHEVALVLLRHEAFGDREEQPGREHAQAGKEREHQIPEAGAERDASGIGFGEPVEARD